mmetsp:Transcript_13105/g.17565  ORF Transcript_13105/g.17565 Transcript_13105/m.17565 type:complete len:96 (-) Transcript_13105:32-319(-)
MCLKHIVERKNKYIHSHTHRVGCREILSFKLILLVFLFKRPPWMLAVEVLSLSQTVQTAVLLRQRHVLPALGSHVTATTHSFSAMFDNSFTEGFR